jgi:hypothetical protein
MLTLLALKAALTGVLGGFLRRFRGGGFWGLGGSFRQSLTWVLPVFGLLAFLTWGMVPLLALPALLFTVFASEAWIGYGDSHDMGRMPAGYRANRAKDVCVKWLPGYKDTDPFWKKELIDFRNMTILGFLSGCVATFPLWPWATQHAMAFIGGMSLMGLAYWIGYRIPISFPSVQKRSPEWGEVLTGAFALIPLVFV